MSYGVAKMTSRKPETYGKGSIDGVAAPESANNSASTGAMLPMMTLGIPGSPTTAVLLAGMVIWGLQPGPLLFSEQPDFVWPLVGSFYISNVIALLVNLAFRQQGGCHDHLHLLHLFDAQSQHQLLY